MEEETLYDRIGEADLNPIYKDGQVYQHTDVNNMLSILKTAVNENYHDIQKLENGTKTVGNANKLSGATLSRYLDETLQADDNKIPSSQQAKAYVDGLFSSFSPPIRGVDYWTEEDQDYVINETADQVKIKMVETIKNRGEYNSATTYEKLNVVTYQGSSYCALKDTTGNLPTNSEYWQLYAEKGNQGDKGDKGDTGETGPQGPQGVQGPQGNQGPQGPKGNDGTGVTILGSYNTYNDLVTEHPSGNVSEAYLIGGYLYVWSATTNTWENVGNIQGPQGPQGPKGDKGDKGDTGPKGDKGDSGASEWGDIGGTLSNQTDLQNALDSKANASNIPTKTSDLTNDSGYLTSETDPVFNASVAKNITSTDITNWNNKQAALVSGTNIKTINNQSILGSGNLDILNMVYPVGSIYLSVNSTSPATLFGGTWEQIKDRFLLSAGDTYSAGDTGGESEHTLTIDEMPSHRHDVPFYEGGHGGYQTAEQTAPDNTILRSTGPTGGNQPHNNMPPYLVVYVWKRTA